MYYNWLYSPDWSYISYDRHMTVYVTGLYIRLVTYARLHIWASVVCFISSTCRLSCYQLSFSYIFIHDYSVIICSVSCCDICTHCLYARAHSYFSYTLIRSLPDDSEFCTSRYWTFYSLFRFRWNRTPYEELESLFSWL